MHENSPEACHQGMHKKDFWENADRQSRACMIKSRHKPALVQKLGAESIRFWSSKPCIAHVIAKAKNFV